MASIDGSCDGAITKLVGPLVGTSLEKVDGTSMDTVGSSDGGSSSTVGALLATVEG